MLRGEPRAWCSTTGMFYKRLTPKFCSRCRVSFKAVNDWLRELSYGGIYDTI